jgi:hypothetical protein
MLRTIISGLLLREIQKVLPLIKNEGVLSLPKGIEIRKDGDGVRFCLDNKICLVIKDRDDISAVEGISDEEMQKAYEAFKSLSVSDFLSEK